MNKGTDAETFFAQIDRCNRALAHCCLQQDWNAMPELLDQRQTALAALAALTLGEADDLRRRDLFERIQQIDPPMQLQVEQARRALLREASQLQQQISAISHYHSTANLQP